MRPDLQFDAETHTYRLAGRVVPSVTQALKVLESFEGIPADVLEAARIRGQYVHAACDLLDRDQLDWSSLDPALVPYIEGYQNWLADSDATITASELRVAHKANGYAGTLDRLAIVNGRETLVDVKATAVLPVTVGPQTAAYANAYAVSSGHKAPKRHCLHLNPVFKRGYKFTALTDPGDWSVFLSCLNVWKFRNKYKGANYAS